MRLEPDEVNARIEAATDFKEICELLFLDQEYEGEEEERSRRSSALKKALELATTSGQATDLWNSTGGDWTTPEENNAILGKMIELIQTQEELFVVYELFSLDAEELQRRQLVRKLFDKADELGYPTT